MKNTLKKCTLYKSAWYFHKKYIYGEKYLHISSLTHFQLLLGIFIKIE